jgi:hypothetical protein
MSDIEQPLTSPPKKKIGFVEMPDHAANLVLRYYQGDAWQPAVVVGSDPLSEVVRLTNRLKIPVEQSPSRFALAECARVVVGDAPETLFRTIVDLMAGTGVEVIPLAAALREEDTVREAEAGPGEAADRTGPADEENPGEGSAPAAEEHSGIGMEEQDGARSSSAGDASAPDSVSEPPAGLDSPSGSPALGPPSESVPDSEPAAAPAQVSSDAATAWASIIQAPAAPAKRPDNGGARNSPQNRNLFDAETILGRSFQGQLGSLSLDLEDARLRAVLEGLLASSKARTASIMLLDADREHLRIAVAVGIDEDAVRIAHPRVGEGIAGQSFVKKVAEITRGVIPCLAEERGQPLHRFGASFPIMITGSPIGVLSINGEAAEEISDNELLTALRRFSAEACEALLSAVRIDGIAEEVSRAALYLLVDRLMSLEKALPGRLCAVAETLKRAFRADYVHAFLLDSLGNRLTPITTSGGMTAWAAGAQPVSRGIFGWAMRHGSPQVFESYDATSGERVATILSPIRSTHPHSMIALENVPLEGVSKDEVLHVLGGIIEQIEGMIAVEEAMAVQDLVSDLNMRIADHTAQLDRLPAHHRTHFLLEFALELTAAEAAVWIPAAGAQPVMTRPQSYHAAKILLHAWDHLDRIAAWVSEKGATAAGVVAEGWDPGAPSGPAPYVGVPGPDGEGVLLVFYEPTETAGVPTQVPSHVLWQVLNRLCERIPRGPQQDEPPVMVPVEHAKETGVANAEDLAEEIHRECIRSRYSSRAFCLTRFRLAGEERPSRQASMALREFLVRSKREVDFLAETRPGVVVLLSPEVTKDPKAIQRRMVKQWANEHPDIPIDVAQRVFPSDDEVEEDYMTWVAADLAVPKPL